MTVLARPAFVAFAAFAAISASLAPAEAGMFAAPHFQRPMSAPTSMFTGPFAGPAGVAKWTKLHTEAPSQFHAPVGGFATPAVAHPASAGGFFNRPAVGPAGAQFGALPGSNRSFVDPTHNAVQARQTQNSVQATNTRESTNAVQGRNCSYNAVLAGLCQRP